MFLFSVLQHAFQEVCEVAREVFEPNHPCEVIGVMQELGRLEYVELGNQIGGDGVGGLL